MSEFADEGFTTAWSFDFEYADDVHYSISGDEAVRLTKKLQFELKTEETRFPVLVHDYLGDVLTDRSRIENAVREMLYTFNVTFDSFHF